MMDLAIIGCNRGASGATEVIADAFFEKIVRTLRHPPLGAQKIARHRINGGSLVGRRSAMNAPAFPRIQQIDQWLETCDGLPWQAGTGLAD
jgi:hypothetical protein